MAAVDPVRITEAPSLSSGKAVCTVKSVPLTLLPKVPFVLIFGDSAERCKIAPSGIGEQDVDLPGLLADRLKETIEVGQLRNVALHAYGPTADFGNRRVELGLTPAGHEDTRAFLREPLGAGQPDAAVGSGDDRDLAL